MCLCYAVFLTCAKVFSFVLWECQLPEPSFSAILRRRLWISHSGAKLCGTPLWITGVSRFFVLFSDSSGFHSGIEPHHFCEWEKKASFTGESIAPLLTRMFLTAPLFPKVTRIFFVTEKRRRLPCGVGCNVLVALESNLYDLAIC